MKTNKPQHKRKALPWNDEELAKLRQLFEQGYEDYAIAQEIGNERTEQAVKQKRHQLNLVRVRTIWAKDTFAINDAIAEYYPKWYKEYLYKQWLQQQTSSR